MRNALLMCLAVFVAAIPSARADWPQYAGPNRDNTSAETGLARSWPAGGPKVLWTVRVGKGYGGPAIQGGKVYLLDRPSNRQDQLRCFDLATGRQEWTHGYAAPGRVSHDGSRSTPAVDEKYIITVGPFGHVHCFSKATKKPLWQMNVLKDYGGGRLPMWAISQSALLYKDVVILAPQGSRAGIVALDKATGKELWKSAPVGRLHYVSPRIVTIGGVDQVTIANKDGIAAVDASDGKVLWRFGGFSCRITIPNATPVGDDKLFMTAGYRAGCVLLQLTRGADGFSVNQIAKHGDCNSQMAPAVLHEGHLYANSNSNEASDGFVCLDPKDGKVLWKTGKQLNFQRGHFILADGMIYVVDGRSGSLHLLEVSPQREGFKELAKVEGLLGPPEPWAPLALSDGKLIIRDQHKMVCLDVAAQ